MLLNIRLMPQKNFVFLKFPKRFPLINGKASLAQAKCPWIPNTGIISHINGKYGLTVAKLTLPTLVSQLPNAPPHLRQPILTPRW